MAYGIKMSDLARMTDSERMRALGDLGAAALAPRNGQGAVLDTRIRELELRYEMQSEELLARLSSGVQEETAEIAHWLFLLDARDSRAGR